MQTSKENSISTIMELDIGNSMESLQRSLESQRELFHSQIDQLQKIVVTQCKLTGANPLSQEMAAAALSINIGKRPRDLLNLKAVKYMQSVFSIKDMISKKESREISALCGVTVTQVREFFAGQRSRVRKLVRLSREKAIKSDSSRTSQDGCSASSDSVMPVIDQIPLDSVEPKTVEETPSCSSKEETIPGIDDSDKNFFENIFTLMRKEVTFSGQVKLMEWILQIQNSSVLYWFLTKGGVMILAAWLSQAALEEQTTVLLVILKVLCHLPLHKALPIQMSAILQSVNRLRFYRTSDISNRAKVLLSRWSKLLVRNQSLKKSSFTNSPNDAQKEKIFSQSEMLNDEFLSKVDFLDGTFDLSFGSSENCRKLEHSQALKQLSASTGDSNKKHYRGVTAPQTRERRKVLMVEQPGRNTTGRSLQVARAVPSNQGRPMSVDDIQKAKMRALFMQSKYGKTGASSNVSRMQKTDVPNKSSTFRANHLLSASKTSVRPKIEEDKKPAVLASETSTVLEVPLDSKPSSGPQESWEKLKRDQIPWRMPPEIRIKSHWRVGVGEKSKEVEIQTGRILREKETIYQRIQDIPSEPKEPWDLEMDCDDSLTPEIPTEQPPDADGAETISSPYNGENAAHTYIGENNTSIAAPAPASSENAPEPDLELLAVLLKNPDLVFALTSGQGSNLGSAETVKLLDMIKASGIGLPVVSNGVEGDMKVEVTSLPSPTPPSERIMNEWRSEFVKDSNFRPVSMANRKATVLQAAAAPTSHFSEMLPVADLVQPQTMTSNFTLTPLPASISQTQKRPVANNTENLLARLSTHSMSTSSLPISQMLINRQPQAINPTSNQSAPTTNHFQRSILAAGLPFLQPEPASFGQMQNVKPAPISIVLNPPKDRLPSLPPLLPTPMRPSSPLLPEPPSLQPLNPTLQWNAVGTGRQIQTQTRPRDNQNYNVFPRGPMWPPLLAHPPRGRNEFVGDPEFELWSPERSPERSPDYQSGRNFSEPRRDYSRNSRPDHWSRRDSGERDYRHGNRRWRDRRH